MKYYQALKRGLSSGFTLVELLVVISIIALLVSILLPALGSAREAARATVCATNLRSLGFAIVYYADDNNNFLPPGFGFYNMTGTAWENNNYWATAISKYIDMDSGVYHGESGVMHCPTKRPYPQISGAAAEGLNYGMAMKLSTVLDFYGGVGADKRWRKMDSIRMPSVNIALLDLWWGRPVTNFDVPLEAQALGIFRPMIHRGRDNFAFLDGHVEPLAEGEEKTGGYITND